MTTTDPAVATTFPVVTVSPALSRQLEAARRKSEAAHRKADQADEERAALVKQAREEGGTLREVGELAGLSHTQVKFIAHGRPPRQPAED